LLFGIADLIPQTSSMSPNSRVVRQISTAEPFTWSWTESTLATEQFWGGLFGRAPHDSKYESGALRFFGQNGKAWAVAKMGAAVRNK